MKPLLGSFLGVTLSSPPYCKRILSHHGLRRLHPTAVPHAALHALLPAVLRPRPRLGRRCQCCAQLLQRGEELTSYHPPPRAGYAAGLCIDDHGGVEVEPADSFSVSAAGRARAHLPTSDLLAWILPRRCGSLPINTLGRIPRRRGSLPINTLGRILRSLCTSHNEIPDIGTKIL